MYTNLSLASPEQNLVFQTKPSAKTDQPPPPHPPSNFDLFFIQKYPLYTKGHFGLYCHYNPQIAESKPKQDVPKMYTC